MNAFDTQVAAQELGIPVSISLQGLLKHFFEVDVSKWKEKYQVTVSKCTLGNPHNLYFSTA